MSWFTDKIVNPLKKLWEKFIHKDDPVTPPVTPDDPVTPPVEPPVTPPVTPPQTGDNNFLWKPVSDSNGKLAVLMPAKIEVAKTTVNGETGSKHPRANGNRQHFRFSKAGASYGQNVKVIAYAADNSVIHTWTVPNGASRWSQAY